MRADNATGDLRRITRRHTPTTRAVAAVRCGYDYHLPRWICPRWTGRGCHPGTRHVGRQGGLDQGRQPPEQGLDNGRLPGGAIRMVPQQLLSSPDAGCSAARRAASRGDQGKPGCAAVDRGTQSRREHRATCRQVPAELLRRRAPSLDGDAGDTVHPRPPTRPVGLVRLRAGLGLYPCAGGRSLLRCRGRVRRAAVHRRRVHAPGIPVARQPAMAEEDSHREPRGLALRRHRRRPARQIHPWATGAS